MNATNPANAMHAGPTGAAPAADPVRHCLRQFGSVPLLDAAEEAGLARRIEAAAQAAELLAACLPGLTAGERATLEGAVADGRRARDHMLRANLRLVVSVAKHYTGRGLPFLDLVQEGTIGLMRAVEKFDRHRGFKFSTYATWWIRQGVTRALANQSRTIRIPAYMHEIINQVARALRELRADLGQEPTAEQVALVTGLTPQRVTEIRSYDRPPISLHTPLGGDGRTELGDLLPDTDAGTPEDALTPALLREELRTVLSELTPREAGVIALRHGLYDGRPRSLSEIGEAYGLTRERIRQIEASTMRRLRHSARARQLREFL